VVSRRSSAPPTEGQPSLGHTAPPGRPSLRALTPPGRGYVHRPAGRGLPSKLKRPSASAAGALLFDAVLGDDYLRPHPVAIYGHAMQALERRIWKDKRLAGVTYLLSGMAAPAISGAVMDRLPGGALAAGFTSVGGQGLWQAAARVGEALEAGDMEAARRSLPRLVGRDVRRLDAAGMARAVIESVAENTSDGIVAPALYAAVGGARGTLAYRAVNTLDSMVGYRDARYRRFGWASARADDAANLVPARVTAVLVAAVRPRAAGAIWQSVRRDAAEHPSPNAGVVEAAFAAALGLRLGGTNYYRGRPEERPFLGPPDGRVPQVGDIARAIRCSRHVTTALFVLLAGASALERPL
jgi:adenosylcobinamide-phosphate synthase